MTKIQIELEAEHVAAELRESLKYLQIQLQERINGDWKNGIYEKDLKLDLYLIERQIEAYQLVLKDYTVETE